FGPSLVKVDHRSVIHGQPQAAIASTGENGGFLIEAGREHLRAERLKFYAVKTGQFAGGSEPKVTVGSLGQCGNIIVGQTIIGFPTARVPGRFNSLSAGGADKNEEQPQKRSQIRP